MQTTADGEYIPAKELKTSFKIPKKTTNTDETTTLSYQQVMEDSYYNYVAEPQLQPPLQPQPPVIVPSQIDAARNLILQSLQKREVERPKTYHNNNILRDTIPDCFDDTLPRDLISLFQPLYCKLCTAQLSSNIVAKLHYKSKNHEKKIRKFLIEYSERTGEPLHKRARITPKVKEPVSDESNPLYFYCDVCDLPLTGKLHAESHYMGKNHRKATLGQKPPAGKGYYDATGKWVREGSSQKRAAPSDDTFGHFFHTEPAPTAGFRCELCNITTTCKEQLESHYNGQKHRKKMKQQQLEYGVPTMSSPDNILSSVVMGEASVGDCSVYRTPSGHYYCHICNSSSNSEVQFKQHLQSKNHLKKASQKKA